MKCATVPSLRAAPSPDQVLLPTLLPAAGFTRATPALSPAGLASLSETLLGLLPLSHDIPLVCRSGLCTSTLTSPPPRYLPACITYRSHPKVESRGGGRGGSWQLCLSYDSYPSTRMLLAGVAGRPPRAWRSQPPVVEWSPAPCPLGSQSCQWGLPECRRPFS